MGKQGRPPKLTEKDYPMLREVVAARPTATLAEVTIAVEELTGKSLSQATVRQALRAAGVARQKPAIEREAAPASRRYGYTEAHRRHEPEQRYPSCLTDAEWALVSDLFDRPNAQGVPPSHSRRLMVDACCYAVRTGCSWRMLPSDFPHWDNVYKTFRRWSKQGKFEQMHDRLRDLWREREDRNAAPTAVVLDAQSTRSSPQGGEHGFDAGKKVKGRKRNLVVDTLGLLLAVTVTAASVQDRDAAHAVVAAATEKYPSVQTCFVDGGYAGQCAQTLRDTHGITVEVVRHPANGNGGSWHHAGQGQLFPIKADANGFVVLPKRWVVERTHGWNERARRLIMHHDRLAHVSEAWVWLAEARLLLRRLTA
jgi:transposase